MAAREIGSGDPSEVVIDELAGMWIALLGSTQWQYWIAAFLVFRLLDIIKPFPANVAERLPGGWGIMADDVVAGVQTVLVLQLALYLL